MTSIKIINQGILRDKIISGESVEGCINKYCKEIYNCIRVTVSPLSITRAKITYNGIEGDYVVIK